MDVAEQYASLVPDRLAAKRFMPDQARASRTSRAILELTGGGAVREVRGYAAAERVRPMVNQANRWQVDLLRQTRAATAAGKADDALLMTMNCVAAGLGWTG
jgi:phosphoenolpyruvate carboxylase